MFDIFQKGRWEWIRPNGKWSRNVLNIFDDLILMGGLMVFIGEGLYLDGIFGMDGAGSGWMYHDLVIHVDFDFSILSHRWYDGRCHFLSSRSFSYASSCSVEALFHKITGEKVAIDFHVARFFHNVFNIPLIVNLNW